MHLLSASVPDEPKSRAETRVGQSSQFRSTNQDRFVWLPPA